MLASVVATGYAMFPQLGASRAAEGDAAKVRMSTGLRATTQSITWIGTEAGIFKKHGIDVSFPRLEVGGPESTAGLIRGDWEFAQTGTVPIAEAVLNGKDPVILLRNHNRYQAIVIMARPEITDLKQLAGKKVGVLSDAYSGQTGVITRLAIEKAGATAEYVGLGTYQKIYTALGYGTIDAGALPVDYRFFGQSRNGWNAFDTASFGVPNIFATTRRTLAANRELVVRVVKGFVETVHLFKTQPQTVVPLLQRFLGFDDPAAAEKLRAYFAPLFPEVPRPALGEGMQEIRDLFAKRYPAAAKLEEADIVDASVIDEVERSGFIAALYGDHPKR
jgi:ABC-type nitrate/sulfonate/bicarbonate transport system substrate-binding protein